jgi:hypothetical protein
MAQKSLTYSGPEELRDRIPDSDLIELTTEGDEAPQNEEAFLDAAVSIASGNTVSGATETEEKVGRIIRQALVHGEGRVNSRVGASYNLPALGPDGTPPAEIEDAVLVLAEEKIRLRRPRRSRMSGAAQKSDIEVRADEVRSWLKSVSRGQAIIARLDSTGTEETSKSGASSGTATRSARHFSSSW